MAVTALSVEQLTELVQKTVQESLRKELIPSPPSHPPSLTPVRHYNNYRHSSPHHSSPHHNNYNNQGSPHHHNNYNNQGSPHHNNSFNSSPHHYNGPPRHQNPQYYNSSRPSRPGFSPGYSPRTFTPYSQRVGTPIKQLKLMVTFVENACLLWAQILSPDIIDSLNQLRNDLQSLCPGIAPVKQINKGSIYGCLYEEQWYRCITCAPPDLNGEVEVLFVDYGNKEKRNITDLVYLRSPKLTDPSFLACPFRLPYMQPVEEKSGEALTLVDCSAVLTGFVNKPPTPDEHTDLYLCRPTTEKGELPTYNELILELGLATKSEDSVDIYPPQPWHMVRSLTHRNRYLQTQLRDKDGEIERLSGKPRKTHDFFSPSKDIRYPDTPASAPTELPDQPADTPTDLPASHSEEGYQENGHELPPVHVQAALHEPIPEDMSLCESQCQTEELESGEMEDLVQRMLLEVLQELKKRRVESSPTGELQQIRTLQENVSTTAATAPLLRLRKTVEEASTSLSLASSKIRAGGDLDKAVMERDTALQALADSTDSFLEAIGEEELDKGRVRLESFVSQIQEEGFSPLSGDSGSLVKEAVALEERQTEAFLALQAHCSDHVDLLSEQLKTCADQIYRSNIGEMNGSNTVGDLENALERLEVNGPAESLNQIGETLKAVRSSFRQINMLTSSQSGEITPLLVKIKASLLHQINQRLSEMSDLEGCCSVYKDEADRARKALANKPDLSKVKEVRTGIRTAKRALKLAQIQDGDSDEEGSTEGDIRRAMTSLHELYTREERELKELLQQAQTTHPELLVQFPQLTSLAKDEGLLKRTWELQDFLLPDASASITESGNNVYCGTFCDKEVFFIEHALTCVTGDLETHALELIKGKVEGCFAIMVDKRGLRAYAATDVLPVG